MSTVRNDEFELSHDMHIHMDDKIRTQLDPLAQQPKYKGREK